MLRTPSVCVSIESPFNYYMYSPYMATKLQAITCILETGHIYMYMYMGFLSNWEPSSRKDISALSRLFFFDWCTWCMLFSFPKWLFVRIHWVALILINKVWRKERSTSSRKWLHNVMLFLEILRLVIWKTLGFAFSRFCFIEIVHVCMCRPFDFDFWLAVTLLTVIWYYIQQLPFMSSIVLWRRDVEQ